MELNELQVEMGNYVSYPKELGPYFTILGINSSVGKLSDKLEAILQNPDKHGFDQTDKNMLALSIGDIIMWSLNMASDIGITFSDMMNLEIRKLVMMKGAKIKQEEQSKTKPETT